MILLAGAVVGFGVLTVAAAVEIAGRHTDPAVVVMFITLMAVPLLGLIVVPGSWLLWRVARGKPDVTFDADGITWGNDRSSDPFIPWAAIERVEVRRHKTRYVTDELVIVHPRGTYARHHLGWPMRLVLAVNEMVYGSPLVVSTVTGRLDADAVVTAVRGSFDGPIIDRRSA